MFFLLFRLKSVERDYEDGLAPAKSVGKLRHLCNNPPRIRISLLNPPRLVSQYPGPVCPGRRESLECPGAGK